MGVLRFFDNTCISHLQLIENWVGKNNLLWHNATMASRRTGCMDPSVKAALYARVSTDDGRQTVANQVRQLVVNSEWRHAMKGSPAQPKSQCDNPTRILTGGVVDKDSDLED